MRSHQECEVGKEERIAVWTAGKVKGGVRRERVEHRREGEERGTEMMRQWNRYKTKRSKENKKKTTIEGGVQGGLKR